MKKILSILLAALLLLCVSPAMALDWSNPDVVSPYSVGIIPIKVSTNIFGQATYSQEFGAAAAGDTINFAVRVQVPDNPSSAVLTIKASNAVINSATTATVPKTAGVYYLCADGSMTTAMTFISGYCTGVPTISAYIKGADTIDSAGTLQIATDSGGYVFYDSGRGMEFYTDSTSRVYSSYVFGLDYRYKLTSAIAAEDSEAGTVARYVLSTLGIDSAQLLAGKVYMSNRILAANFGKLVDTETSKTWGINAVAITPVAEVPATSGPYDLISFIFASVCLVAVFFFAFRDMRKKK